MSVSEVSAEILDTLNDSEFMQRVRACHESLGIPADYKPRSGHPLCLEPPTLVPTELDCFQRPQQLTPEAFTAWSAMKQAAAQQGVTLFLISAYRSVQYQADLIAAKLKKGQTLDQILTVNAAPGFSEHHTGRALDLGTPGSDILQEEFEKTDAFQWLINNSASFGFRMSYPRDNPFGIVYEPWHWYFEGTFQATTEA